MDDALARDMRTAKGYKGKVLILVVMDDALAPMLSMISKAAKYSLNPCCNG